MVIKTERVVTLGSGYHLGHREPSEMPETLHSNLDGMVFLMDTYMYTKLSISDFCTLLSLSYNLSSKKEICHICVMTMLFLYFFKYFFYISLKLFQAKREMKPSDHLNWVWRIKRTHIHYFKNVLKYLKEEQLTWYPHYQWSFQVVIILASQ